MKMAYSEMTSTHMLNNYETIDIGEEEDAKTLMNMC